MGRMKELDGSQLYWVDSEGIIRYRGRYTLMEEVYEASREIFATYAHHTPVIFYVDQGTAVMIQIHRGDL